MRKKAHRHYTRFVKSARNDWLAEVVYRRETWVFRRALGYWATAEDTWRLCARLADHFQVPEPKLVLRLGKRGKVGGWFHVRRDGTHNIFVRGSDTTGTADTYVVTNECKHVRLVYRVAVGEYRVHSLLHEFAHYLCFLWWKNGAHDRAYAAVDEIVHEWYMRQRSKLATRRSVRVTKE